MFNKKPELFLIRGLPGSGKSTYARQMERYKHLESDMYFMVDGKYVIDFNKLKDAHKWCISETEKNLNKGKSVVVSNTFVQLWEMSPYFEIADKNGISCTVIVCRGKFKNTHDVPESYIKSMAERWEDYYGEIEHVSEISKKHPNKEEF